MTVTGSFSSVFGRALQGEICEVAGLGTTPKVLPVATWRLDADPVDLALLADCCADTMDIGCGPGRLAEALVARGHRVLGIDIVAEAVGQTRRRGVHALLRDVFEPLPHEGRWQTVLLADGNVGIGGDPECLLARVREILAPHGQAVVEVEAPGVESRTVWASLECEGVTSRPFRWSVVSVDTIGHTAEQVGLAVVRTREQGGRWWVVLQAAQAAT